MTPESRRQLAQYRRRLRERNSDNPVGRQCNMDSFVYSTSRCYQVGPMDTVCIKCQAIGYRDENKGTISEPHFGKMCCMEGKYTLDRIPDLPDRMRPLFEPAASGSVARHFQNEARRFNGGVALGATIVNDRTVRARGPAAAFKICGEVKRSMSGIVSQSGQQTNCVQTYFCDPEYQDRRRADRNQSNRAPNDRNRLKDIEVFRLLRESLTIDCNNR